MVMADHCRAGMVSRKALPQVHFFRLCLLSLTNGVRNCNINCHNYADQGDCFDGYLEAHAILYIQTRLSMMMILVLCE